MTERGRLMCLRVCGAIAALVPDELGRVDAVWSYTAAADAAFIEAVELWDQGEGREHYAAVRKSFDEFVDTWREAASLWRKGELC